MNKFYKSLFILVLFFAILFCSCTKESPSGNNFPGPIRDPNTPNITISTGTTFVSNCSFWVKDYYGFGDIYIESSTAILKLTIAGETKTLFYFYNESGPAGCGLIGTLNFNLPLGLHTWTATSLNGSHSTSGLVSVTTSGCTIKEILW